MATIVEPQKIIIKVVSAAKPTYWYAIYIGQQFDVYANVVDKDRGEDGTNYVDADDYESGSELWHIFSKDDCKVIDSKTMNKDIHIPKKLSIEQYRELSAGDITKIALTLLSLKGFTAWRQTNNAPAGRKGVVKKGVADIMGYARFTGIAMACEVKTLSDRLREEQKEFLTGLDKAGGYAFIACQVKGQVEIVPYHEYEKK